MNLTSKITCVGLLLAVSTLATSVKAEATSEPLAASIESRLSRLTEAIKERGVNPHADPMEGNLQARGWANGNRGSWVNVGGGGFANRPGSFINRSPWRNGSAWRNGGSGPSFANRNWGDGGRFYNHSPWRNGGSFYNRW